MSQEIDTKTGNQEKLDNVKEIDLIQGFEFCLEKLSLLIGWLRKVFRVFVRLNVRYWFVCLCFFILAVAAFCYKGFLKPNVTTQYDLRTKGINYVEIENKILELQNHVNPPAGNVELIDILKLDSVDVKCIRNFSTLYCIDQNEDGVVDSYGTMSEDWDSLPRIIGNQLAVYIKFSGMPNLQKVGDAVVNYLNADSMNQRSCQNYIKVHEEEIAFNMGEIQKLDSLRQSGSLAGNTRVRPVNYSLGGNVYEGGAYTQDMLDLSRNISSIKLNLGMQDQPVRSTSKLAIIEMQSKLSVILHYSLPIYLLGLVLVWLFSERKRIVRYVKRA